MPVMDLHEVSGALERPGGCVFTVEQRGDGAVVITIPRRGFAPMWQLSMTLLAVNLVIFFYVGLMVFFNNAHGPGMDWLFNHDGFPLELRRFEYFFMIGWIVAEGLGVWIMLAYIRPIFMEETLRFDQSSVRHTRRIFQKTDEILIDRTNIQGFHLQRDPQGFARSSLFLVARGEHIPIAEQAREIDLEWLASVGNVLLRRD